MARSATKLYLKGTDGEECKEIIEKLDKETFLELFELFQNSNFGKDYPDLIREKFKHKF